jgi:cellulose synthase/poly-beta-1,6-N-acetylglucosamine synthase-like glycosyltransferase
MMMIMAIAIIIVLMIMDLRSAINLRRFASAKCSTLAKTGEPNSPISIFVPCKGDDGRLYENLETLLNQDCSNAEFVFVTALEDDPAQSVFRRLKMAHPNLRIKTVVAGIYPYGSEKNNNLLKAIDASDPASKIFVLVDSDGKNDGHLIRKMVYALENSSAAVVTGMRWYEPRWTVWPEVVRTAWNTAGFLLLADPQIPAIWGGAAALRRKTYEETGISKLWAQSLTDDNSLSRRLYQLHLKTEFLPNCVVLSSEKDNWLSLFRWVSRQTLSIRASLQPLFMLQCSFNFVGNGVAIGLLAWGLTQGMGLRGFASSLCGISWFVHYWLMAWLVIEPIEQMAKASGIKITVRKSSFIIAMPMALTLLQMLANIRSIFSTRLSWAGVTYELHGQTARRL